ncbi:MAG: methionyl-tRNA formyltransferase [Acetobacterales bacterium]
MSLRLAFMGTPDFSVSALDAIVSAGHEAVCVYSQPPRAAGRGHKTRPSPVQARAEALGLPVRCPLSLKKDAAARDAFAALNPDVAVVVAYGLILPAEVLSAPRLGCVNIHASLLPRWRGAAPIQHAILAGDSETGITIMQMDEGLDTGPMLLREAVPILPDTTAAGLHDTLAELGAKLIVEALAGLEAGTLTARPQPAEGATYASKLTRADGVLDWTRAAGELERQVRALTPWPGTWTTLAGEPLKVLRAERRERNVAALPGAVLDDRLTVACGDGALGLIEVQRAGKRPVAAADFLRGQAVPQGTVLGTVA